LCGHNALLVFQWLSDYESAVLEYSNGITKDEINGTCDNTIAIELTHSVCVKCVLVTIHSAFVED
jgi:hypothetical protein